MAWTAWSRRWSTSEPQWKRTGFRDLLFGCHNESNTPMPVYLTFLYSLKAMKKFGKHVNTGRFFSGGGFSRKSKYNLWNDSSNSENDREVERDGVVDNCIVMSYVPNYGTDNDIDDDDFEILAGEDHMASSTPRVYQVQRGPHGFGFTLSGQSPCILSSVSEGSTAQQAGLCHGDQVIQVNGIDVSKASHDEVVALIGQTESLLTVAVMSNMSAENINLVPALSSSEEEEDFIQKRAHQIVSQLRQNRLRNEGVDDGNSSKELVNILFRNQPSYATHHHHSAPFRGFESQFLKVVVSYLGSISRPLNPDHLPEASHLAAEVSCSVRKLFNEKRVLVALQVTQDALVLSNHRGTHVARFTQDRIVYYGMEECDPSYFGIVTRQSEHQLSIHIFVLDKRLVWHNSHARKARTFKIACSRDPKSNTCKEFPATAQPIMIAMATLQACPLLSSHHSFQSGAFHTIDNNIDPSKRRLALYDSDSGFRDDSLENVDMALRDLVVGEKQGQSPSKTSSSQISLDSLDMIHTYKHSPRVYTTLTKQHSLDALDQAGVNTGAANKSSSSLGSVPPSSVQSWNQSFDNILNHPQGILIFAKFLKKEFAQENIFFWTACEQFKQERSSAVRKERANEIFEKHLADDCPEPVNIDNEAHRNIVSNLAVAPKDLFSSAQKQIYNLMKYDCYPRFVKSDLYQQCLIKELNGEPLLTSPAKSDKSDLSLLSNFSNRSNLALNKVDFQDTTNGNSSRNTSKSSQDSVMTSGGSIAKARKSLFNVKKLTQRKTKVKEEEEPYIIVTTPDGVTRKIAVLGTETLAQIISNLLSSCQRSTMSLVDVFVAHDNKPVDLQTECSQLYKEHITIEPRCAFLLAIQPCHILGIKCEPTAILERIVQSVCLRFGMNASQMAVRQNNGTKLLDPQMTCGQLDGGQLVMQSKNQPRFTQGTQISQNYYAKGQDMRAFLSQVQNGEIVFDDSGFSVFCNGAPPLPPKPKKFLKNPSTGSVEAATYGDACNISFV